jgi:membrane protease YdiL (CAAX protease family)
MVFWLSIFLSSICILKTKKSERQVGRWDVLFFLSSWQIFDLLIWRDYLAQSNIGNPFEISALLQILLTIWYIKRRGILIGLSFSKKDFSIVLKSLAILALILIPVGLQSGFLKFNPRLEINHLANTALGYYLFVAPSEELIFRGVLQNLLERSVRPWLALLISNILFATIYTHVAGGNQFPNWHYVGMAFIAGLAYGGSYLVSRKIWTPILVHGSADTIWRIFLT